MNGNDKRHEAKYYHGTTAWSACLLRGQEAIDYAISHRCDVDLYNECAFVSLNPINVALLLDAVVPNHNSSTEVWNAVADARANAFNRITCCPDDIDARLIDAGVPAQHVAAKASQP
jgi:hypothetical protein